MMSSYKSEKKISSGMSGDSSVVCRNLPGVSSFLIDHSGGENNTVRDIAVDLQITNGHVVDALKRLDETGLIQLKRNRIIIKDINSLKDLSVVSV